MKKSERVLIACPTCTQRIRAPRRIVGQSVTCPTCRNLFTAELPESLEAPGATSQPAADETVTVLTVSEADDTANDVRTPDDLARKRSLRNPNRSTGGLWILGSDLTPTLLIAIQALVFFTLFTGGVLATVICIELIVRKILLFRTGFFLGLYSWLLVIVLAIIFRLAIEVIIWLVRAKDRAIPTTNSIRPAASREGQLESPGDG